MGLPLTMKPSCQAANPWQLGEGERAFGVAMEWVRSPLRLDPRRCETGRRPRPDICVGQPV